MSAFSFSATWPVLVFSVLLSVACNKPELDDCRKACWNYHQVMFWEAVDKEVEGLPVEEAAKIRAQKEAEFKEIEMREEDQGLMNCITNCQSKAKKDQVKCMQKADDARSMKKCMQ